MSAPPQGNYGEVYRGQMTDAQGRQETVAIKSLKAVGQTDDLKREFKIMQVKERVLINHCIFSSVCVFASICLLI